MGQKPSKLAQEGYVVTQTMENYTVATKGDDTFLIKMITLPQFSGETAIKLMPKLISVNYPNLSSEFSFELCDLLGDLLNKDPKDRPTASEVLARPIIIKCLRTKCETTVEELQTKLEKLRALADGLERVHEGTTIGSLTGGVIGAVGGITSIVGLILAPFTLGASLIVTGVGVGVGAVGGVTAGASNITNMVNQSSRAVRVAEAATGVLSGLFVAVDMFFIAMDAKEIYHIREAREEERRGNASPPPEDENDNPAENRQATNKSASKKAKIKSEVMKFVKSVREAAENLEKVLGDLRTVILSIPLFQENNELEWQNME